MKLSILASVFFASMALAAGGGDGGGEKTIPLNGDCKKDGSMGNCETNYCEQPKDADQGKCKQPK